MAFFFTNVSTCWKSKLCSFFNLYRVAKTFYLAETTGWACRLLGRPVCEVVLPLQSQAGRSRWWWIMFLLIISHFSHQKWCLNLLFNNCQCVDSTEYYGNSTSPVSQPTTVQITLRLYWLFFDTLWNTNHISQPQKISSVCKVARFEILKYRQL